MKKLSMMWARFRALRGVRKFLRGKLSVAALIVIGGYVSIGLGIATFDLISVEQTLERVAPNSMPGFLASQPPEKRLLDCEFFLEAVDRALKQNDPAAALGEVRFAELHAAQEPPDALRQRVTTGWAIYDELAKSPNLNEDDALLSKLEELEAIAATLFAPLSGTERLVYGLRLSLGTDRQGRSNFVRATYSIKVAILIGGVTALISVFIGTLLGAAAGYFGGMVDIVIIWLYSIFASIPSLVLLTLLAYMFTGSAVDGTLIPVYVAFCSTFWIGPCRIIRGETLKLKELEYIHAAKALGLRRLYILLRHIVPNTVHLIFINFSLLFIGAIKSEVILTFLGLGVKRGASWGLMIKASVQEVIRGHFWQIGAATIFMFVLVLAFNIVSDALQDAFDPKHI